MFCICEKDCFAIKRIAYNQWSASIESDLFRNFMSEAVMVMG